MRPRALRAGVLAAVVVYFLAVTWRGLQSDFNPDDVASLYHAWIVPILQLLRANLFFWEGHMRPLGALFYRLIWEAAGFYSLPFRIACFVLLVLNLGLQYWLYRLLFQSELIAAAALVFGCFRGPMWDVYASTAIVFDVLSQTFVLATLILYVRTRVAGRFPGWIAMTFLCCGVILSINAKEMGFALPVILLCYELVFHTPKNLERLRFWISLNGRGPAATLVIATIMWMGRVFSKQDYGVAYLPQLTWDRYMETTQKYVYLLFFNSIDPGAVQALAILLALLAIAVVLRSGWMIFGWLFYMAAMLPISFVAARHTGYVLYVPFTGWAIYAAGLCAVTGRVVTILFICGFIALQVHERSQVFSKGLGPGGEGYVRALGDDVTHLYPHLPPHSRLLVLNDPFGFDEWAPLYTLTLRYRDPTLLVRKIRWDAATNTLPLDRGAYDHIFICRDEHYTELK